MNVFTDIFSEQPEVKDGYISPLSGPGLGVELLLDELPNQYKDGNCPVPRRSDGSFTNW